jgi:hypothetical protein
MIGKGGGYAERANCITVRRVCTIYAAGVKFQYPEEPSCERLT